MLATHVPYTSRIQRNVSYTRVTSIIPRHLSNVKLRYTCIHEALGTKREQQFSIVLYSRKLPIYTGTWHTLVNSDENVDRKAGIHSQIPKN